MVEELDAGHHAAPAPRRAATRKYPLGGIMPRKRVHSSKVEERVRTMLQGRGIEVLDPHHGVQAGLDPEAGYWPILTPDLILKGHRVAIEVDPTGSPDGPAGHDKKRAADEKRNRLMAEAGWTLVRLRLGLGEGSAIGPFDVETESVNVTVAAIDALVEAVRTAIAGSNGVVRFIPKDRAPQRKQASRLGAIAQHQYEAGWYVSWLQDSGKRARYALLDGGKNLYAGVGWDLEFVADVGLDALPREQWRSELEAFFSEDPSPLPASRFPWGSEFFTGEHDLNDRLIKLRISAEEYTFTANVPDVTEFTGSALIASGKVCAELHPEAVRLGWEVTTVEACQGRSGEYLRVRLVRNAG